MKKLDANWLTQDLIDFEYKKYILLAYLQEVKNSFKQVELYPYLSDLIFHYQNLLTVKTNQQLLFENFPQHITKADFENLNLHYTKMVQHDGIMEEIENIIGYALPQLQSTMKEGKDIYEYIANNMEISMVGIRPLSFDMGYLFLDEEHNQEMSIYEYQITIFENASEKFRGIHTTFVERKVKTIFYSFEKIKLDLIRRRNNMPNPATYLVHSKVSCSLDATLLPVAKRLLMQHLGRA